MGDVGVGMNDVGGSVGVELGGIGLRVEVAVGRIIGTGGVVPQATNKTTRMIVKIALIVCFIPTSMQNLSYEFVIRVVDKEFCSCWV